MEQQPAVYVYCRKSTHLQEHSLETQKARIDAFCDIKGWKNRFYYEDTSSGTTMDRVQFKKMMSEIKSGSYLVVYSLSRISRSVRHCHQIFEELEKKHCKVVSLNESLDTSTAVGKFNTNVLMSVAQLEVDMLRDRICDSMATLIKQGKLRRKPQYGYKFVSKNLPFVEEPKEQAIIARVLELHKTKTVAQICRLLDAEGVTIRNAKRMYPQVVSLIIRNNTSKLS